MRNTFSLPETLREAEYCNLKKPPEPDHRFEVTLESNAFTEEKYKLFEKYQRLVHKEKSSSISRSGFKRFLCSSPIPSTTRIRNGIPQKMGSYHQCYRLDGKLIALGVLDLLPRAVSSVYLLYDVDYERFGFGKLSALREVSLALEEGYQYYYMGYYIHSCLKMRYKNDYKPQYILDPDTYAWDPLDEQVQMQLGDRKFVSLSRERGRENQGEGNRVVVSAATTDTEIEQAHKYPTAVDAARSGVSLLIIGMPGLMSLAEMEEQLDLDQMIIEVPQQGGATAFGPAEALVSWERDSFMNGSSIKGSIAELIAGIGPEVARKTIVDLTG